MRGTTNLHEATAAEIRDDDKLRLGDDKMYVKSIRRLKHYKETRYEVIDVNLTKICSQNNRIKSCRIPSLYSPSFSDYDFSYIRDKRLIARLGRTNT